MLTVRDFSEKDRSSYINMSKDFYSGDSAIAPVSDENFSKTFSAVLSGDKGVRGCIIEKDGETAGYALLPFFWSCETGGTTVVLDELYILPQFRGSGLGSQFMQWLLKEYENTPRIRLEVCHANLRVKHLYERYGFEELPYIQMTKDKTL